MASAPPSPVRGKDQGSRSTAIWSSAWVTVANTGPVISEHEIPALFEPFRRLRDRTRFEGGNGLGLSIVRAVARAHGGDVTAASRPGGGLVVRVALPYA